VGVIFGLPDSFASYVLGEVGVWFKEIVEWRVLAWGFDAIGENLSVKSPLHGARQLVGQGRSGGVEDGRGSHFEDENKPKGWGSEVGKYERIRGRERRDGGEENKRERRGEEEGRKGRKRRGRMVNIINDGVFYYAA
jgi:hypothetical protein